MFFQFLMTILLAALGGILYRMGGAAKTGKWYDFLLNTKTRDFGIPTVSVFLFFIWSSFILDVTHLSLILTWGLIFAAQTTYWKKKGANSTWKNWLLTGLGYSMAWIITVICQNIPGHVPFGPHATWLGFLARTIACTGLTVVVSELYGNVVYEENARGVVEVVTIPLLFI